MTPITKAQDQTDTMRDMLLLVQQKQPDTQVTLHFNDPRQYAPYGPISHIGDTYVCVMMDAREYCGGFEKVTYVELYPGIHR